MDPLKEAFQKVREDMEFLYSEMTLLKSGLATLNQELFEISQKISDLDNTESKRLVSTQEYGNETTPTGSSTQNHPLEALKTKNMPFSIGNEGVPTDKQTNRQTNQQTEKTLNFPESRKENSIENAARILESLDSLKKEIRIKFKQLTDQEVLVFSTLYQIDEETGQADYKTVSMRLNLSESSIRDYVGRLIKKGIPIDKKRVNNKSIILSISPSLKKIASLPTILQLRDL